VYDNSLYLLKKYYTDIMIRQGKYTKRVTKVTKAKRTTKRSWRWFKGLSKKKKVLVIAAPILAFLIITPLVTYAYYYNDIADQERLMNRNNTGVVLMDKNGETFYNTGRAQHRDLIPLNEISDNMEHALVASEDKDFYTHSGFSITGILRALYDNVVSREITGGGSTLTQQLAKITLLTEEQTILRKYQELAISVAIEQRYSKEQILDMYLNSAFFGGTTFGIEDAAKKYFGKLPKDLDLAQSAMLVGILPAPNAYSPVTGNPEYAKERQTTVLTRMVTNGYITEAEKNAALAEELTYAPQADTANVAPHFTEMVLKQLYDEYDEEKVIRSGYQVRTTLDLGLQRKLEANVASHMSYIQRNGGSNVGGVAIDPTSGEVRALVGSADWDNPDWGNVNMATTARQPGSSFKPIYYSEALAEGVITPATILQDVAKDFNGYKPLDADRLFRGDVTVRSAISQSLNIPSVEVMERLGIEDSMKVANRLGISSVDANKNYGLSLALGSAEAPLIEMTNAYAAFANQGQQYNTTIIQKIDNKFDKTIFTAQEAAKQVISAEGAFLISNILSDNNARAPIFGSSLTVPGRTAAVKTGTTDNQRDAWTIGYTPQLAVGVWVGNNDNAAMINGGSGMAGPIWVNTMKQALTGVPNTPFVVPPGIIQKPICYGSGALSSGSGINTYNEYFLASALPVATCSPQQKTEEKTEDKPKDNSDSDKKDETDTGGSGGSDDDEPTTPPGDNHNGNDSGSDNDDPQTPSLPGGVLTP
jgi:1A family penicillin-binding protein